MSMSDYACEDLIIEIFTRLPSKSLLRFRSLSKSVCSSISSPGFIRMHSSRSPQKVLFRHGDGYGIEEAGFYTLHGEDQLPLCSKRLYIGITPIQLPCGTIVDSCNGTFCFRIENNLSLWNPSVRRKLNVPECPLRFGLPWAGIGFGFDQINDDYKIVCISYARHSSFVYTVKTDDWCAIASPTPLFSYALFDAFFFNGVLHWVVHGYHIESQDKELSCILTFDLSTHIFGMIPLPELTLNWEVTRLTTIQDSLALISYRKDFYDSWIRVWRDVDASWSLVFKLEIDQLPIKEALQLTNNGDLLLNTYEEGVQFYNSKTGARSRLVNFNDVSCIVYIFQYVESLHLIDMGTSCEKNQLSVSGGKNTGIIQYLNDLFYYFTKNF